MFTVLPYEYRCASNYKQHGKIVLVGVLSAEDRAAINERLHEGAGFIPGDLPVLDIDELQPQPPSASDHVWHTLDLYGAQEVSVKPEGSFTFPVARFVEAFREIDGPDGWEVQAAVLRLGV